MSSAEMTKTQVEPRMPQSVPKETNSSRTPSIVKLAEGKNSLQGNNEKKPNVQANSSKGKNVQNNASSKNTNNQRKPNVQANSSKGKNVPNNASSRKGNNQRKPNVHANSSRRNTSNKNNPSQQRHRQRSNANKSQVFNLLVNIPVPVGGNLPSPLNKVMKVCRDFIHNICPRDSECPFYHPPKEINDGVTKKGAWFAVCPKTPPESCNCSFFHISENDKKRYQQEGEISPDLVQAALQICLLENLTLLGSAMYCKAFLRGLCQKKCPFQHLSLKQFEDEVFYEMKDELAYLFPHSESFPQTADGIQQPEDMKMEHQMEHNFPNDPSILMQEIHELRSEYINTRRNLEEQVTDLETENSQLRTQVQAFHTANTVLNEEVRQAQETARQLENDKYGLQKILDGNTSNATTELKNLLEDAKKEAERAREAFSNVNADMMIQNEIEKRKLIAEIDNLKTQLQGFQNPAARGVDMRQLYYIP